MMLFVALAFCLFRMFASLRAFAPENRREFCVFEDQFGAEPWLAAPRGWACVKRQKKVPQAGPEA